MSAPSQGPDWDRRMRAMEDAIYNLQRERSLPGSTLDNCPTGAVIGFLSSATPPGWLWMVGQAVDPAVHPALHAYLVANGLSTTLPDCRNRFFVGAGDLYTATSTGGSADAAVVDHTHHTGHAATAAEVSGYGLPPNDQDVAFEDRVRVNRSTGVGTGDITDSTGSSDGADANLPPYQGIYWIIRT
jgi:hypothetical protein